MILNNCFILYTSDPVDRKALAMLADFYTLNGDKEKAKYIWEKLLETR